MNDSGSSPVSSRPAINTLVAYCAVLSGGMLILFPAVAWIGYTRFGTTGVTAAGIAVGLCWLSSLVALILTGLMRGPQSAIQGVLLGMLFRMGIPLAAGLVLSMHGGPLAKAGIFEMILVFYLVALVLETVLSVRLVRSMEIASKAS